MKRLPWLFLAFALNAQACETIGHVNNNPTNLRKCGRHWASATGVDAYGHLKFPDEETGLRIAYQVLKTYEKRYHIHSIEHLCGRWVSPQASWKAKQNWIRTVQQRTHTKPGAKLIFSDPETARLILKGIVYAENSCDEINERTYKNAVGLK